MAKPIVINIAGFSFIVPSEETPQESAKRFNGENKAIRHIVKSSNKNKKLLLTNKKLRFRG